MGQGQACKQHRIRVPSQHLWISTACRCTCKQSPACKEVVIEKLHPRQAWYPNCPYGQDHEAFYLQILLASSFWAFAADGQNASCTHWDRTFFLVLSCMIISTQCNRECNSQDWPQIDAPAKKVDAQTQPVDMQTQVEAVKSSSQGAGKSVAPVTAGGSPAARPYRMISNSAKECSKPRPSYQPMQNQSADPCADLHSNNQNGASGQSCVVAEESNSGSATGQRSKDGIDAAAQELMDLLLQ